MTSGSFKTVPDSSPRPSLGAGNGTGSHPALSATLASWRPSARLEPVERYDRFEILGRIGRGGMAEILLARERSLTGATRHLVIKRVLPEVRDFDEMLHMFLDETRVVMGLSHPNLCQIYEVGEHDGAWFIAMEWVNGVTLHQLLRHAIEVGDVDYGVLARVIGQTADALHYAHTARDEEGALMHLVHRDVSPHNVMVAFDGRVKLLDFGIAKSSTTTHETEAGVVKGKICYMAPEQWLRKPLDGRTDVFALGACLFEALSGRVLFKRESQSEVMRAALEGDIPRLAEIAPNTPPALAEIAYRALSPDPERRFQTAREMGEALERFVSTLAEPVSAARVADYTRRLFASEVRLGPVLERSLRGAQLAPNEGMFLPPLPQSLLSSAPPLGSGRPPVPLPFAFGSGTQADGAQAGRSDQRITHRPAPRADTTTLNASNLGALAANMGQEGDAELVTEAELPSMRAPTRPKTSSETQLSPVQADMARPLARTLSLRAVRRARRVAGGAVLALAGLVTAAIGVRALLEDDAPVRKPLVVSAVPPSEAVAARGGAEPTLAFTLLAPGEEAPPQAVGPVQALPVQEYGQGRLSINTKPWSTVYLGKRTLGTTPLADVAVPRGALNLRFVDRDGKVHIRRVPASKDPARSVHFEF